MAKKTNKPKLDLSRIPRKSGEKFSLVDHVIYNDVRIACYATGERAYELRDEVHVALCRAGGFKATARITNEWAESGRPRRIRVPLKPKRLRRLLERLDDACHAGLLEIRISGARFA